MKPRILVFTTAYHPFIGGAEIAIQEIAERLKDRFDFYIITSRFRRDLPRREIRPEGTVIRLGFGTRFDKWLLPFLAIWNLEFGIWNFPKRRVVLWGVDISQGSLAAAVFKLFHPRIPFIFNIQYGDSEERLAKGRLGTIGMAFRFMLSRVDHVTTLSGYLLDLALQYGYKGPVEIIPNGVDVEKFKIKSEKLKVRRKGKIIITTSRLVLKNGIGVLIQAMAEIKRKMPDIQCWILGDGPEGESLKLQVKSLKLEENVKFFGEVSYDKIPEYLHQADIFVRPSRSEGMGNSFVEALTAGLPIIGTKVGGITDIIEDGKTGLFARVDDPKDFAEKVIRLLVDRNLAESIVRNGQKMVAERFIWKGIAESYVRIFKNVQHNVQHSVLHILMATPLYPPQIGGPALYAKHLGEEFEKLGHDVRVASFTGFLRYPSGIRHLFYFLFLLCRGGKSEVIFALDYTSVGLPAAVASFILRRPLIVRVEGDFLWESFVERTRRDITLSQFYQVPQPLTIKERFVRKVSGWVMRRASRLVFSSEWRRSMIMRAYKVSLEKTIIIRNVFPSFAVDRIENSRVILWAGRMLYLKNLYRLIRAFVRVNDGSWELHLVGDGPEKKSLKSQVKSLKLDYTIRLFDPMTREKLLEKMECSAFFVLPSFSDVGPNVIADAVAVRLPFILTEESGYAEHLKNVGFFVNPLNEEELKNGIIKLMHEDERRKFKEKLERVLLKRSWEQAAEEWLTLFSSARDMQSQAI